MEKILNKEDLEFLKELAHELKTQDNDYNASPVFWGIQQEITRPTGEEYSGTYIIYETSEGNEVYDSEEKDLEYFKNYLLEGEHVTEKDLEDIDEDNLFDFIKEHDLEEYFGESYITKNYELVENTGAFLTKRAAKKHIELNSYHYNKPRTYAMTAWRNEEFGKLIKIIEKFDLGE